VSVWKGIFSKRPQGACVCIFEKLMKSYRCYKMIPAINNFESAYLLTYFCEFPANTVKKTGCDDHMSICVRGYFGIRWLHITRMVFGHTHTAWSLSVFVSIVTQHALTWVSEDSGLEAPVLHNMTALDEPWLDSKWSSWEVGAGFQSADETVVCKCSEMRKCSPLSVSFSVKCKC